MHSSLNIRNKQNKVKLVNYKMLFNYDTYDESKDAYECLEEPKCLDKKLFPENSSCVDDCSNTKINLNLIKFAIMNVLKVHHQQKKIKIYAK